MKRKLTTLVLIVLFLFSLTSTAFAVESQTTEKPTDKEYKGKSWKAGLTAEQLAELRGRAVKDRLKVNGNPLEYDVPPVIKDGRTLIPVRAIMNGLKAEVEWNAETKTITITRDDVTVVLTLGSMSLSVNGEVKTMDVPAQLISNRTFVPLRFIAEALGDKVEHDADTGDIEISGCLGTPEKPVLAANIATWTAVANENNGYSLTLYRNDALVTTVAIAHGAALSYDFSASMTTEGSYTVKAKALATGDYTDSPESQPSLAQVVGTPAAPRDPQAAL